MNPQERQVILDWLMKVSCMTPETAEVLLDEADWSCYYVRDLWSAADVARRRQPSRVNPRLRNAVAALVYCWRSAPDESAYGDVYDNEYSTAEIGTEDRQALHRYAGDRTAETFLWHYREACWWVVRGCEPPDSPSDGWGDPEVPYPTLEKSA